MTGIEWTDETWNPTTGCDKVSPGCGLPRFDGDDTGGCYAMAMAKRLKSMGQPKYQTDGDPRTSGPGFGVAVHPETLDSPLRWRKPRRVFVNSMSDLFHEEVPTDFIARVWAVMATAADHTFQILTKRHARMRSLLSSDEFRDIVLEHWARTMIQPPSRAQLQFGTWPLPNVHLGVSTENQKWADIRIPALLDTPAAVRWISAEPLLGPIDLTRIAYTGGGGTHLDVVNGRHGVPNVWVVPAKRLDWIVCGGESGKGARPMHPAWARIVRDQCETAGVPFLFKQRGSWTWDDPGTNCTEPDTYVNRADGRTADEHTALTDGGEWQGVWRVGKRRAGRDLDYRTHDEYPSAAGAPEQRTASRAAGTKRRRASERPMVDLQLPPLIHEESTR